MIGSDLQNAGHTQAESVLKKVLNFLLLLEQLNNPSNLENDQHLISPYNNTAESFIKIMRITGNDHRLEKL